MNLDKEKELVERVGEETTKFLTVFCEKYVQVSIFSKIEDRMQDTIQKILESKRMVDESEEKKQDDPDNKNSTNDKDSAKKSEEGITKSLPIINIFADDRSKQTGPDGNEYISYNFKCVKLNVQDSVMTSKQTRYKKLRTFKLELNDKCKDSKNFPFPDKKFWGNKESQFLDARQKGINDFLKSCCDNYAIATDDMVLKFFNLEDDPERQQQLELFRSAVIETANSCNFTPPTQSELDVLDCEEDMLVYTLMQKLRTDINDGINSITGNLPAAIKNGKIKVINFTIGNTITTLVRTYWSAAKIGANEVDSQVDDIINKNGDKLDDLINKVAKKVIPLIEEKFSKSSNEAPSKADGGDEKVEDDHELGEAQEENEELKKKDVLQEFHLQDMLTKYDEKLLNEKDSITKTSKEVKHHLLNWDIGKASFLQYNFKDLEILDSFTLRQLRRHHGYACKYILHVWKDMYNTLLDNLVPFFEYYDKIESDSNIQIKDQCESLVKILQDISAPLVKSVESSEEKHQYLVKSLTSDAAQSLLNEPGTLGQSMGDFFCNLANNLSLLSVSVSPQEKRKNFVECVSNEINSYVEKSIEHSLDTLYDATKTDISSMIQASIAATIGKVENEAISFLPQTISKYVPFQSFIDQALSNGVDKMLEKYLEPKKSYLNKKLYDSLHNYTIPYN